MLGFYRRPKLVGAISVLLLGAYLMAALGVWPSPRMIAGWLGRAVGAAAGGGAERFPCESCGCVCLTATECWTHCCCHNEHQRLVWAIENGVMPPASVVFRDAQWEAAADAVRPGSVARGWTVARIKLDLAHGVATPRGPFAGAAEHGCGACGAGCGVGVGVACERGASCAADSGHPASRLGPSISALSCKGLSQLLLVTLPPAPPSVVAVFDLPAPRFFVADKPVDVLGLSRGLDVPVPPPRA